MAKEVPVRKIIFLSIVAAISALAFMGPSCRSRQHEKEKSEASEASQVSEISLTPQAIRAAGIQTEEVDLRPAASEIHAPAEIVFNPKRLAHVTARSGGRIEQLLAYPGEHVQKGQILLLLYSRDFLSVQAEYLQAAERLKRIADPGEKASAESLAASAKNKLRILDMTDAELAEIESTGKIITLMPVRAPLSGTIIESALTSGDTVEVGASLFRIADLSTVWANVHIFEKDLTAIRVGCVVTFHTGAHPAALPVRVFKGTLFQIGSVVDEKTRTVEARVELANHDGQLRPGMFAEADIVSAPTAAITVSRACLQEYQNKKIVFVLTGENSFSPRYVETGAPFNGYVEILAGLRVKERVAANGSFFLKSELLKKTMGEE